MSDHWKARYFIDSIATASGATTIQFRLHGTPMKDPSATVGLIPQQINIVIPYSAADCGYYKAAASCTPYMFSHYPSW